MMINECPKKSAPRSTRIMTLALAFVLMMFMTACTITAPNPITSNTFQEKMEASGYTVVDIIEQFAEHPHMLKAFGSESDTLHIEFYEINSLDNTAGVFSTNKSKLESYSGTNTSAQVNNYKKFTIKTSEKYYVIMQVETTFIYSYSNASDSAKLDELIKNLGY
ncbi:MAG: hypothetical protein FWG14_08660 [Peptococcaceae bacterium]|nr:hypothetical protein [Peptococcaceae bacterium]